MKFKPWLWLPPQLAHDLAPFYLGLRSTFCRPHQFSWSPLQWKGLNFANRLGIAGGVDKNGSLIRPWWTFGPGFVEVGTVTPRSQNKNTGCVMARDASQMALWNYMGFPNRGVTHLRDQLLHLPRPRHTPIFVNIGRNRSTDNSQALADYSKCIEVIGPLADAFVINISSPNTEGLRELFQPDRLQKFLSSTKKARDTWATASTPLLLKLSPDLGDADFLSVIESASNVGIDGFIATNTTLERPPNSCFPSKGGVSGQPLAHRSKKCLTQLIEALGSKRKQFLIVSVGGILTAQDVFERLEMGADLVQVYTALIFQGPKFFRQVHEHYQKTFQL